MPAPDATDDDLLTVHDPALIEAVMASSADPSQPDLEFGLGSDDNPTFPNMHEAARHVVGASIEAARQVWTGQVDHAANIAGGLHHAMPDRASGFCVYNDVAVAIRWLLANGAKKVAYVDVDVHHGDGVERIFYDDPRVLTDLPARDRSDAVPRHRLPGRLRRARRRWARRSTWRCRPAPPTPGWLRAFHAVVPPLLREFAPDVLVTQQGCDSHRDDPLAHLALSVDGQRASYLALHDLAHEVADGRWVAFGGGGYAIVDVVPRAWTHLLAVVSGTPLDAAVETPLAWRDEVRARLGVRAPSRMTDGRNPAFRDWSEGYDPDTWLDRAIQATRDVVFPSNGLDPHM